MCAPEDLSQADGWHDHGRRTACVVHKDATLRPRLPARRAGGRASFRIGPGHAIRGDFAADRAKQRYRHGLRRKSAQADAARLEDT